MVVVVAAVVVVVVVAVPLAVLGGEKAGLRGCKACLLLVALLLLAPLPLRNLLVALHLHLPLHVRLLRVKGER